MFFSKKKSTFFERRIPNTLLHLFTRQLASLLNAGLPLLRALQILAEQESHPLFKRTLLQLAENIQHGNTFSESLALYPHLFSSLYLNMVRAGELGGMLGIVLNRLALFQEKMQKVKNKAASILFYPVIVLIMTLVMMTFLLVIIIPKFEAVFADVLQGQALPPLTHLVLELSRYTRDHILLILSAVSLSFIVIKIALTTEPIRSFFDRALLKTPLLGPLLQKHFIAQCFNTLGTLMLHGVPILQAVTVTQKISDNRAMQSAMKSIHDSLQAGDQLIHPLKASKLFPPMVISMIAVGEETGQLSEMLLQIATIYEEEVEHYTTQFMTLMEPCIILLLACFVGTIVIALFLPLMSMMNGIQNQ